MKKIVKELNETIPPSQAKAKKLIILVRKKTIPKKSKRVKDKEITQTEVRPYLDFEGNFKCHLCGSKIHDSQLYNHMTDVHAIPKRVLDKIYGGKDELKNHWVSMFQGGLPSLGKNSR